MTDVPDDRYDGLCPACRSPRWVSVSLNGGLTRIPQCVPCGAYHRGVVLTGRTDRHSNPGRPLGVQPDPNSPTT